MKILWKLSNQYIGYKKIGVGGFAVVYKAADVVLRKFVAVKQIKEEYTKNEKVMAMFRKEAINTAKLEHENIVKVINFFKEGESHYLILDFVNGVDLEFLLRKSSAKGELFPPGLAAYVISETLRALVYAHNFEDELTGKSMNFVHYDISPGNIMLYYDGRIKLTDFGIAKAGGSDQKGIRGKISYVSPEQVRGESAGPLSDLFSSGLVFYEAMAGKKAYEGDTSEKLQRAKNAKIDMDILSARKVPQELIEIVKKMLKKDPEKRYSSAEECLADIQKYLEGQKTGSEWKFDYRYFLNRILKEEIIAAEAEAKKEAAIDFQAAAAVEQPAAPSAKEAAAVQPAAPPAEEAASGQFDPPLEEDPGEPETSAVQLGAPAEEKPEAEEIKLEPLENAGSEEKSGAPEPVSDNIPAPEPSAYRFSYPGKENSGSEEKEKTVFDFVLDTAKKYKRIFVSLSISLAAALLIFTIVDTYTMTTPFGLKIHNIIWPPALSIDTFPTGARIRIIDTSGVDIIQRDGYKRITPSYIEKLQPGTYTLRVSKDDYGEMSRVITVLERETGEQQITIAGAKMERQTHIIPFEVRADIASVPSGAILFINGRNVGRTPFSGDLEIGRHSIQLVKEGFEILGSLDITDKMEPGICVIDTSRAAAHQGVVDRRFWDIREERLPDRKKKLNVTGTLWKFFSFESQPEECLLSITNRRTGETDYSEVTPLRNLMLNVGEYDLKAEKNGYQTWEGTLKVDVDTQELQRLRLKKYVTVRAVRQGTSRSVNADVIISNPNMETIRGRTPLRAALPLESVQISLSNEPSYTPVTLSRDVNRLSDSLSVGMSLRAPHVTVSVKDYTTGRGIESAAVWINGMYWKRTGSGGTASGHIEQSPGTLEIEVKSDEYGDHAGSVNVSRGQRGRLDVTLGAPRDGTVKLDIPEGYSVKKVLVGDKSIEVGPDMIIKEIARGLHSVEVEFEDISEKASGSFSLTDPLEVKVLKVTERTGGLHLEAQSPPRLRVTVRNYANKRPVQGAYIWLGNRLLGETGADGVYSAQLLNPEGRYILKVTEEGLKETKAAVTLENNRTEEIALELNAPSDGTVIVDVSSAIYDAAVYIDGEYKGHNVKLVSDIPRGRRLLEIRSEILSENVSRVFELSESDSLAVFRVHLTDSGAVLEEINPQEYLR